MADRLVVNTSPLVILARADLLEVVGKLPLTFVCPREVIQEIDAGIVLGYPDVKPEWLVSLPLSKPIDPLARASLDLGEAAVIQLALEQGIEWVCVDDRKGRRAALAVGLKVTGVLGILARARTLGLVPALRPLVDKLVAVGAFFDRELLRQILEGVGE
jgi:uncharacterized protein